MTGASKILTVSYGTFSCTLEGFDEPFNTMKAIAEYFRDLAADDRYFGAEPPVPDAAMLHRIAEREINRRVEAKIQENGVHLRAEESEEPSARTSNARIAAEPMPQTAVPQSAEPQSASAPAPAAHPVLPTPRPPLSRPVLRPEPSPQALAQVESAVGSAVESAAARLSRLRSEAAARDLSRPAVPNAPAAPLPAAPVPVPAARDTALDDYVEDEVPFPGASAAGPLIDNSDQDLPAATEALIPAPSPAPKASLATAEDADLRALVSETLAGIDLDEAKGAEPDQAHRIEAELIAAEPPQAEPAQAEPVEAEVTELGEPGPAADRQPRLAETLAGLIDDAEILPSQAEVAAEAAAAPAEAPAPAALEDQGTNEKLQRARARVIRVRRVEPVHPVRSGLGSDRGDGKPLDSGEEFLSQVAAMQRADAGASEEDASQNDAPQNDAPALSVEAEAQLAAELAALEMEAAPQGAERLVSQVPEGTEDAEVIEPSLPDVPASALEAGPDVAGHVADAEVIDVTPPPEPVPVSEDALSRLIQQTNSALDVPESKRRRSAIEHLKAAVRATLAERKVNPRGEERQSEERKNPYRRDLDSVVRREPAVTGPAQPGDRPPPLVLVSAQRILRTSTAPAPQLTPVDSAKAPASAPPVPVAPVAAPRVTPVHPRRVRSGGLAIDRLAAADADEDGGDDDDGDSGAPVNIFDDAARLPFPAFVEQIGPANLAELLEAAAAYNAVVLDRPQFPRGTLFKQLESLTNVAAPSREDGLRSFGKLLREGRIVKTKRGQFGLPDASPALGQARRLIG